MQALSAVLLPHGGDALGVGADVAVGPVGRRVLGGGAVGLGGVLGGDEDAVLGDDRAAGLGGDGDREELLDVSPFWPLTGTANRPSLVPRALPSVASHRFPCSSKAMLSGQEIALTWLLS